MVPSYPHTLHWYASLKLHRDDHYHPDCAFFLGKDVVITEKLDGGVTWINRGSVYARSSDLPTREPWFDYVKGRTLPKFYSLAPNLCVAGEDLYGVHSIEYDPLPDTFFLFHVLERLAENIDTPNTTGDFLWSWASCEELANQYGVNTVPVLHRGRFGKIEHITEFFMDNIKTPSIYGPVREGFVMRIVDSFPFDNFGLKTTKFVRANHVQTNSHWTKTWKPARLLK